MPLNDLITTTPTGRPISGAESLGGNPGFFNEFAQQEVPAQTQAAKAAKKGLRKARRRLEPFEAAGLEQLAEIENLLTPEGQTEFITQNPFFDLLAEDAENRLLNNAAARGRVGSGGTAEALQNSLLLLGNDLVNEDILRRQTLFNPGFAASSQIADLEARAGETQAAGILGLENTRRADSRARDDRKANTLGALATLGTSIALSDRRYKTNINHIADIGFPVYLFKYKGSDRLEIGTMAQDVPHAAIDIGGVLHVDYSRL